MITQFIATKKHLSQAWDKLGRRLPVTVLEAAPMAVVFIRSAKNSPSSTAQVALTQKQTRTINQPLFGHLKKAGLDLKPRHLKELTLETSDPNSLTPGQVIKLDQVFSVGDTVKVTGRSKGRGFTGVVKRWGFAGGPRTHGQSDRERAPGSIGQGTTPGRVYKGKKMAGRHGNQRITINNLVVIKTDVQNQELWLKGTVPGPKGSLVFLTKTKTKRSFPGLFDSSDSPSSAQSETVTSSTKQETPDQPVSTTQTNS
jgi:large subunit ribosomal protein L3